MSWATNNLTFRFDWIAEYLWGDLLIGVFLFVVLLLALLVNKYDDNWLP